MNYATYAVAHYPFAKVPHYEVFGTNDGGATCVPVVDDRTGKPAEFLDLKEAKKVMRGLYRAQIPVQMSLTASKV